MKRRKQSNRPQAYTMGELNKLIDALIHPLTRLKPSLLILDGLIHSLIEQNPPQSLAKFTQHNLPKLIAQLMRGNRRK